MIIVPDNLDPGELSETLEVKVSKVFDGDGFLADVWHPIKQRWLPRVSFRFAFIDAPEMGQPFGEESRILLQDLIEGKSLRLAPIIKQSNGCLPIEQYKRLLCMAYLTEELQVGKIEYYLDGETSSGTARYTRAVTRNVELEMIVNGLAWVAEQYTFDREDEYFRAQENAWHHRRGLWSQDDPEPPWGYKERKRRRQKVSEGQLQLFAQKCDVDGCDGHYIERRGPRGLFLGCSNFPRCRNSREHDQS